MNFNVDSNFTKRRISITKAKPVDQTLTGTLLLSNALKARDRQKFRIWGGVKIPIQEKDYFNKKKDHMNEW